LNDFKQIADFIGLITPICDKKAHHPDFQVFDYKFIKFELTTHDKNRVTQKDFDLAEQLDLTYKGLNP
jgi:pterin-4a-carbinolamine dehydratase